MGVASLFVPRARAPWLEISLAPPGQRAVSPCHIYHHTFGSQLAMKGESLYKIATLMGNSPEICRRHYAALLPEALFDSVEFCNRHAMPIAASPA